MKKDYPLDSSFCLPLIEDRCYFGEHNLAYRVTLVENSKYRELNFRCLSFLPSTLKFSVLRIPSFYIDPLVLSETGERRSSANH